MQLNTISKRSKVQATNIYTNEVRKDIGATDKPRIFTVEEVGSEIKLYQVGTYENPLRFSVETGLPYLAEHSRSSSIYKNWKNYRIEAIPNVSD